MDRASESLRRSTKKDGFVSPHIIICCVVVANNNLSPFVVLQKNRNQSYVFSEFYPLVKLDQNIAK
jgi:hypothetical protein